jgi:dihydrofolate reductase
MRVTLFESISVNGMIARPDGDTDFFSEYCWSGFAEIAREAGAMIWGRATHDLLRGWAGARKELEGTRLVVLTRDASYAIEAGWMTAPSPEAATAALERVGCERALVVGGQTVNTAFARAGLLDEVMLFVESVVITPGMPLFSPDAVPDLKLRLREARQGSDSVLVLRYEVLRA